ncbi:hypothetical protein FOFC_02920 [Fusarium oxysporum]|nr:hypothetical protein FOFC_02920 [Fusarium oxysporum]
MAIVRRGQCIEAALQPLIPEDDAEVGISHWEVVVISRPTRSRIFCFCICRLFQIQISKKERQPLMRDSLR